MIDFKDITVLQLQHKYSGYEVLLVKEVPHAVYQDGDLILHTSAWENHLGMCEAGEIHPLTGEKPYEKEN